MNIFKKNLGIHADLTNETLVKWVPHTEVFQFFVSRPVSFSEPSRKSVMAVAALRKRGLRVVVHGPFLGNLTRGEIETENFCATFAAEFFCMLREMGVEGQIPYVLHTNKPLKGAPDDLVKLNMQKAIGGIVIALDRHALREAVVCIETDACPRSKWTNLAGLGEIVRGVGDPRIQICLDTEHSYASGLDESVLKSDAWEMVKVLHLNGIPGEVRKGGGLDRHSKTKIRETSAWKEELVSLFDRAVVKDIPVILERDVDEVILDDMEFLSSR